MEHGNHSVALCMRETTSELQRGAKQKVIE